jgi:hypothetical protein
MISPLFKWLERRFILKLQSYLTKSLDRNQTGSVVDIKKYVRILLLIEKRNSGIARKGKENVTSSLNKNKNQPTIPSTAICSTKYRKKSDQRRSRPDEDNLRYRVYKVQWQAFLPQEWRPTKVTNQSGSV